MAHVELASRPTLPQSISGNVKPFIRRPHFGLTLPNLAIYHPTPLPDLAQVSSPAAQSKIPPLKSQDVFAAAILSEVVYKQVDLGNAAAEEAARYLGAMAPLPLTLGSLDWSTSAQSQSYVVGETEDAMVVAFLGTKKKGDLLVSLNLRAAEAFLPLAPDVSVHKGYLSRALSIPTEELYKQATAKGKRLVFAGHSMGGAVATLCALHLLCLLPPHLHRTVSAVGFATPPLGNAALAAAIEARGWGNAVRNFRLQEDWVPDAVALWRSHARMTTTPAPSPSSAFDPGAGDQWVCWGYAPAEAAAA